MTDDSEPDIDGITRRMDGALTALKTEFNGLRTGRASVSLLEPVVVEAYGSQMPLNQVSTVNAPEARLLTVQVWDRGLVHAVEKAILTAGLGLNPATDGTLLRIPIPELNEERRKELSRVAAKYAEQARVAIRNVRRDGMESLKKLEKDGHISEDDHKAWADEVQELTDAHIKLVDDALSAKQDEIMQV